MQNSEVNFFLDKKISFRYGNEEAFIMKKIFIVCALSIFFFGCSLAPQKVEKAKDVYRENVDTLPEAIESLDGLACQQNLLSIQDVLRMAHGIDGRYPETLQEAAGKDMPSFQCPKTHAAYVYHPTNDGEGYEVQCPNPEAHKMKRLRATEEGLDTDPKLALPGAAQQGD